MLGRATKFRPSRLRKEKALPSNLRRADSFSPIPQQILDSGYTKCVHVEGWDGRAQFRYLRTVNGVHHLMTPKTGRSYQTRNRLGYTLRHDPGYRSDLLDVPSQSVRATAPIGERRQPTFRSSSDNRGKSPEPVAPDNSAGKFQLGDTGRYRLPPKHPRTDTQPEHAPLSSAP